jgi:hypothetical protein
MSAPDVGSLVRLVRLPSVVTVPGDVLLGSAWSHDGKTPARAPCALATSSSLAYLAGMALNDWADREQDARERPGRPIPAGQVEARDALALAIALSTGAIVLSARAGGIRALSVSVPLMATIWVYDLKAKRTAAGPWVMALARSLDVMVGAGDPALDAAPAAGIIGAHALLITFVSRREAQGATAGLAIGALAGVVAMTVAGAGLIVRGRSRPAGMTYPSLACLGLYAWTMTRAGVSALRSGDAVSAQRFVGTGVFANMPLQAALLARRGRLSVAASILAAWPAVRRAARQVAVS